MSSKPKERKWTAEQLQAIRESGQNILVSAGAGSGKTAVLTQRIIEKIKKGTHLANLIVLTFTNEAANEMKERVRKALKEEFEATNDKKMKEQLDYLDQANIQTFDSFALRLCKKYYYLLGVDENISVADPFLLRLKLKTLLDDIFLEKYQSKDEKFATFIKTFCTKSDETIKEKILLLYKGIELLVDENDYLDNYHLYLEQGFINERIDDFVDELKQKASNIKHILRISQTKLSDPQLIDHLEQCVEQYDDLFRAGSYDDFYNLSLSFPRLPSKADEDEKEQVKTIKAKAKKIYDGIKAECIYSSVSEMSAEILLMKETISVFVQILKELFTRIKAIKKAENSFSFGDIAKMAIKLMANNRNLCEQFKNNIEEILIDEYQDTSDIQETLINYIASNNVYMVGDVKQSIYRFRNANPLIFMDKYQRFKDKKGGLLISLNHNFRSRNEVIKNINEIFINLMEEEFGGVRYDDGHQLQFGNKAYDEYHFQNNDLTIKTYKTENTKYSKCEQEAIIVANDIIDKVNNGYLVYDMDHPDKYRPVNYSDFAILTPTKSNFDEYQKVLESFAIPVVVHKEKNFIANDAVIIVKNLFQVLSCFNSKDFQSDKFRFSLLSVLRSFLIDADEETIYELFTTYKKNMPEGLNLLFPDFYEKTFSNSSLIQNAKITDILGVILQEYGLYNAITRVNDVCDTEDIINYLTEKVLELSELGYTSEDFLTYLDELAQGSDIKFQAANARKTNACTIINIHKSKGLEFNICYFLDLNHRFNQEDVKIRILFDKGLGLICPNFIDGLKDTLYKKLFSNKEKRDMISEQIRLFYVGLTRAKDKMIFVMPPLSEKDELGMVPSFQLQCNSFHSFLTHNGSLLDQYTNYIDIDELFTLYEQMNDKYYDSLLDNEKSEKVNVEAITLKKQPIKKRRASSTITKFKNEKTKEMLELGTTVHKVLEMIDFTDRYNSFQKVEEYLADDLKEKVRAFLDSELFALKIIRSYHELPFVYYQDQEKVEGIIDLVLETEELFIIVDYKLNDLTKESYQHQLATYKTYLQQKGKEVKTYLYSIVQNNLLQI